MPWPVTINGNTYTEAMFKPRGYVVNFPAILSDLATVAAGIEAAAAAGGTFLGAVAINCNDAKLTINDTTTYAANVGGILDFAFKNASGTQRTGARLETRATTGTNGAEVADFVISTMRAGTLTDAWKVLGAGTLIPAANDGAAIGSTTYGVSDLFLASGGVINFNNGNLTATHASGRLSFTGSNSTGAINFDWGNNGALAVNNEVRFRFPTYTSAVASPGAAPYISAIVTNGSDGRSDLAFAVVDSGATTRELLRLVAATNLATSYAQFKSTLDASSSTAGGAVFDGGLAVAKIIWGGSSVRALGTAGYYFASNQILYSQGTNYTGINANDGAGPRLQLGDATVLTNYYNNDQHAFRSAAFSAFAYINSTGLGIGISPSAVLHVYKSTNGAAQAIVTNPNTGSGAYVQTVTSSDSFSIILQVASAAGGGASSFYSNSSAFYIYNSNGSGYTYLGAGGSGAHIAIAPAGGVTFAHQMIGAASTTARATLRIPSGTAPTSPVAGDFWFDGTNLKFRDAGGTTRTITWT